MPGFCGCGVEEENKQRCTSYSRKKSLQLCVKILHYTSPRFDLTYTHNSISDILVIPEQAKPKIVYKFKIHLQKKVQQKPTLIKSLLLLSSPSSSSSSPLCRVFILIFLRQTISLGNTVLQLFCCYYSWCLYR